MADLHEEQVTCWPGSAAAALSWPHLRQIVSVSSISFQHPGQIFIASLLSIEKPNATLSSRAESLHTTRNHPLGRRLVQRLVRRVRYFTSVGFPNCSTAVCQWSLSRP